MQKSILKTEMRTEIRETQIIKIICISLRFLHYQQLVIAF